MDAEKNYVGKVVKVHYKGTDGKDYSQTGVVYEQEPSRGNPRLNMLLVNGSEWSSNYVAVQKITSARIDENLRAALTDYCKAKVAQKAFLDAFWKQKFDHEGKVKAAQEAVREFSGAMSHNDFMDAAVKLLESTFPSARHSEWQHNRYFAPNSISSSGVTISHVQEIEKYIRPEKYPFVYREYDDNLFVNPDHPSYKKFCEANAPAEISGLKGKAKTSVCANVGDKNFLTVSRTYTFPLKHGISKQSLQELKDLVTGQQRSPLDAKIKAAEGRAGTSQSLKKTPEKGR